MRCLRVMLDNPSPGLRWVMTEQQLQMAGPADPVKLQVRLLCSRNPAGLGARLAEAHNCMGDSSTANVGSRQGL